MAVNSVANVPLRMSTKATEARQTPDDSFGKRLQNGASATAGVVAQGAAVAAPFVPGGAIVSAAVSGVSGMASASSSGQTTMVGGSFATGSAVPGAASTSVGAGASVPSVGTSDPSAAGFGQVLQQQQASQMQYLALQNQMQQENQTFSTISNLLKVRHDTCKNSISNIH